MKIYTKKGDEGKTSLADGTQVFKYDERVELYGLCDELNSFLGLASSIIKEKYQLNTNLQKILQQWEWIQNFLFEIGAELAGYYKKQDSSIIKEDDVVQLEKWIDEMTQVLPELRAFIIPNGSVLASQLHICRTLCRRLERKLVQIFYENKKIKIYKVSIRFLNRLSDYFFISARFCNYTLGIPESEWYSNRKS